MSGPAVLDLTGGHLDVKVNRGDGEAFIVPLPADLTGWTFTATAGLTVEVTPTQMIVRIPAAVTAELSRPVQYKITCRNGTSEPTTLLTGLISS